MMTGRRASQTGYGKTHPLLLDFNPTLAERAEGGGLRDRRGRGQRERGRRSTATRRGFDRYRETWEEEDLRDRDGPHARHHGRRASRSWQRRAPDQPFFLWLHYVNPHAPYTPPAPYDTAFLDAAARGRGRACARSTGFHGGIRKEWAVPGQDRLGYYVAQYDGEIATVDQEVGTRAGRARPLAAPRRPHAGRRSPRTTARAWASTTTTSTTARTSSTRRLRIPLHRRGAGRAPGGDAQRRARLHARPGADRARRGEGLVSARPGGHQPAARAARPARVPGRDRLFAQNDRNLTATFDARLKVVATPTRDGPALRALRPRGRTRARRRTWRARSPTSCGSQRRELELFLERADREWAHTRRLLGGQPGEVRMTPEACEQLQGAGLRRTSPAASDALCCYPRATSTGDHA